MTHLLSRICSITAVLLGLSPLLSGTALAASPAPQPSPATPPGCYAAPAGGHPSNGQPSGQPNLSADCQNLLQAQQDLSSVQQSKGEISANLQRGNDELTSLEALINDNEANIAATRAKMAQTQAQMVANDAQLAATTKKLARERVAYAAFVKATYQHQDAILNFIFSAANLADLADRMNMVDTVTTYGTRILRQMKADQTHMTALRASLRAQEADLSAEQQALQQQVGKEQSLEGQLNADIGNMRSSLETADQQRADILRHIAQLEVQQLDDLITLVEQAAWDSAQYWMSHNLVAYPVSPADNGQGGLAWPVTGGTITQPFGPSAYDMEPPAFGFPHFHTGIDIADPLGTPVMAAADGVVVAAEDSVSGGHSVGYGRHVIIAHQNGLMTLYAHLDSFVAKPGQQVHQGDLIGYVGSTGNSTGPHLHFEVRSPKTNPDGSRGPLTPVDPRAYLPSAAPGS